MIKGIRKGNESSFEKLFDQYYRQLSVFAVKYLNDLETSKEIVQDLFVHIFKTRRTLIITSSLRSYLYQSVRHRCLNYLKQKQTTKSHLEQLALSEESTDELDARIFETELEHRIFQIVDKLPERCREIFTLSRIQGITNKEIASRLNISIRTVETQISKALRVLRDKLGNNYFS